MNELLALKFFLEICLMWISLVFLLQEISLGIIGNLACHEVPLKCIVSTNGLVEIIVDQLFLDDAQCLSEVCR